MDFSKKRKAEENGNGNGSTPSPSLNLTPDDARRLLQPLSQDQLLDTLQAALLRHPDVLDSVRAIANRDTTLRKLFVRGLAAETTSDSLRSVFASYGLLDEAIVIFDKNTAKSKGYGFVTFKNADAALLALREPSKKIDGRITVTQFAAAGVSHPNSAAAAAAADVSARKIYVGNVPFDISSERLLGHFMMYGEIEEGPLGFDKATGKSKGFAFFVYKTEDGAKAALVDPMKTIDGHQVACKLAVDNKKTKPTSGYTGEGGGGGGGGVAPPHSSMPGSFPGPHYGPPGPGGLYQGYPGGGHHGQGPPPPQLGAGSYGPSSIGNQAPSSLGYGSNFPGPYNGPLVGEFGGRLPPSSGGYPDGSQYGLTSASSSLSTQHNQAAAPPPVPRVPPGGMYQGLPHYY